MKVLFDVNMPRPLRRELDGHEVVTAQTMGWSTLENGDLIAVAEKAGFDVLVTADRNLRYQQNITGRKIAILILPGNRLRILTRLAPAIREALHEIKAGEFLELNA